MHFALGGSDGKVTPKTDKNAAGRRHFIRGTAFGVIASSAVFMTASFLASSAHHGQFLGEGAEITPAVKAAEIVRQALVLSDKAMNRDIVEADVGAIVSGALGALDPYSGYVEKEVADRFTGDADQVSDRYLIGVLGDIRPEGYVVRSTMPKSPAEEAGLEAGDMLVSVNGDDVSELSGALAFEALNSATQESRGDKISVGFLRKDELVVVTLSPRPLPETYAYDLGTKDGYLHVGVRGFYAGVSEHVDSVIEKHYDEELAGVVLDLRRNAGGLTSETKKIGELIFPKDTLLFTEAGKHIEDLNFSTTKDPKYPGLVVGVLIDEHSASASEILASAVQANKLGPVVGRVSFGKGTIQNVYPFNDGSGAIKITVGEYKDAEGRTINKIGVFPDVVVTKEDEEATPDDEILNLAIKAMKEHKNG